MPAATFVTGVMARPIQEANRRRLGALSSQGDNAGRVAEQMAGRDRQPTRPFEGRAVRRMRNVSLPRRKAAAAGAARAKQRIGRCRSYPIPPGCDT